MSELVVGVVVTYNPGPYLAAHLAQLREQMEHVVVVDNGSSNLDLVRAACMRSKCRLIPNERNLGIAAALNQGAREALALNAAWLAMFDQDSLLPAGAIKDMLAVSGEHPERDRIGIVSMTHRDRGTGNAYHAPSDVLAESDTWRILRSTITSGSLVRCAVIRALGAFEEALFIDFVDHEYCLRIRRHGWLVIEARRTVMTHSIGASRVHRVLGRPVVLTHHNPVRRYYITRNQLEIYCRNLFFDPRWAIRGLSGLAMNSVMVLLCEEQAASKSFAMLRACADFLRRRFGPM
jgi:rhamnosyltransferase